MSVDNTPSGQKWKWVATIALLTSGVLLAALLRLCAVFTSVVTDDRLIGTWQSDADRTIAHYRDSGHPVDDKQETKLRTLFGKMQVTYQSATCTSELNGVVETEPYQVLGRDKHSVAIRIRPSSEMDFLELSSFVVIQFEGPDSYWLVSPGWGNREYFQRIKKN